MVGAAVMMRTKVSTALPPTTDCGATTAYNGSDCGGSWDRGKAWTTDVNNNPRGGDRHAKGAVIALDCGDGRGSSAQRRQQRCANKAQRWPRWRQQRRQLRVVPCPRGGGLRGQAASRAARVRKTPQRGRITGGVATTTGGPAGAGEAANGGQSGIGSNKEEGGYNCIMLCVAALARCGSNVLIVAELPSTAPAGKFVRAGRQ